MTADALAVVEIKAFVPARDFALSKQYYRDIGFTMASDGGGVAYFHYGHASFLLQDFCTESLAENFMMHLLVEDVETWWKRHQRQRRGRQVWRKIVQHRASALEDAGFLRNRSFRRPVAHRPERGVTRTPSLSRQRCGHLSSRAAAGLIGRPAAIPSSRTRKCR